MVIAELLAAALMAAGLASPALPDTCRFDLPGTARRNPDAMMMVIPQVQKEAVDSLGMYAGWLFLGPGLVVPEHQHAEGDEFLWVVCGGARFRIDGNEVALAPGSAVRIPKGTTHAALVSAQGLVAVQVYRPGGPGLRFYAWEEVKDPGR
jgi:mannose-6-phosphate isomerase-like protein (cupin superfamily)